MLVRNDLKNSEEYKKIIKEYQQKNKREARNFLFYLVVFFAGIIAWICFTENQWDTSFTIYEVSIALFLFVGWWLYCFFKIREKYDVYQITVGKKIIKKVYGAEGVYQYFIKDIDVTNINIYTIEDIGLFDRIKENQTYLFFAKNNVLYDVF